MAKVTREASVLSASCFAEPVKSGLDESLGGRDFGHDPIEGLRVRLRYVYNASRDVWRFQMKRAGKSCRAIAMLDQDKSRIVVPFQNRRCGC